MFGKPRVISMSYPLGRKWPVLRFSGTHEFSKDNPKMYHPKTWEESSTGMIAGSLRWGFQVQESPRGSKYPFCLSKNLPSKLARYNLFSKKNHDIVKIGYKNVCYVQKIVSFSNWTLQPKSSHRCHRNVSLTKMTLEIPWCRNIWKIRRLGSSHKHDTTWATKKKKTFWLSNEKMGS